MLQVGYQVLESLLPFRRMDLIAFIVRYALRRERDCWVQTSAILRIVCRWQIQRRTSRFEGRVYGIRWLFLPFSKLQLCFLFDYLRVNNIST